MCKQVTGDSSGIKEFHIRMEHKEGEKCPNNCIIYFLQLELQTSESLFTLPLLGNMLKPQPVTAVKLSRNVKEAEIFQLFLLLCERCDAHGNVLF